MTLASHSALVHSQENLHRCVLRMWGERRARCTTETKRTEMKYQTSDKQFSGYYTNKNKNKQETQKAKEKCVLQFW